jgi:hypothetical protein
VQHVVEQRHQRFVPWRQRCNIFWGGKKPGSLV